jgi:SAM-dependent methyltransferase
MSASGSPAPACPLCASHDHTEILRITQPDRFERAAGVSAPGYLRTWYECRGCGLLINVGPPFDRAQVYGNTYYDRSIEKESVAERYARIMALPPSKSDNYLRAARVRDEILSLDGSRPGWRRNLGQVLDVGAGSGVFLARFQQLASDWQCTAIEPNPDACEHLRTLPGIQVVGNFFAPDIFSERFELVTLNKVLEHVQDPVTFLSGVGEVLAPRAVPPRTTFWEPCTITSMTPTP